VRILISLLFTLLLAAPSAAQTPLRKLRIATGPQGQTYSRVYGAQLLDRLRDYNTRLLTTEGSAENLEKLLSDEADLAFVQADVYASRVQRDPGISKQVAALGRLADECVYVAYRKSGPIQSFDELKGSSARIGVGPPAGGASQTWSHLASLDPELGTPQIDPVGGSLALNRLDAGALEAVVWVTDPANLGHPLLRGVYASSDLSLLEIDDPSLELSLPEGPRIYQIKKIRTKKGWLGSGLFGQSNTTLCTGALLLGRSDLPENLLARVSEIVSLQGKQLTGR